MKEGENNHHEETNKTRWSKWIEHKKENKKKNEKEGAMHVSFKQSQAERYSHELWNTVTSWW